MLSEFDTAVAVAVARGLGLLGADQRPDEERSHLESDGYALIDVQSNRLALVSPEALRSWIPSHPAPAHGAQPLSIEEVVGLPSGPRWQYLVMRLDLLDDGSTTALERVRINGLPFDLGAPDGVQVHQFHELLDLLGDRGWELVIATVSRAAAGSGSAPAGADIPAADPAGMSRESYRITFKRPRPA